MAAPTRSRPWSSRVANGSSRCRTRSRAVTRPISRPDGSTSGSFFTRCAAIAAAASASVALPVKVTSRLRGVIRLATVADRSSTNCRSRSVSSPSRCQSPAMTTSVPTRARSITARASASVASGAMVSGSGMTPCCVRLTFITSRTCGSMSPGRNPRSMMPMPPSSAMTIAISARVTVSMLAETIGRFRVSEVVRRADRSIVAGSRRSTMLICGVSRKSSKVHPATAVSRSMGKSNSSADCRLPSAGCGCRVLGAVSSARRREQRLHPRAELRRA